MTRLPTLGLALSLFAALPAAAEPAAAGRVTRTSGDPFAGAEVALLPVITSFQAGLDLLAGRSEPEPVATGIAGDDGRFELAAPGPGLFQVRVRAGGHVPMISRPLALVDRVELGQVRLRTDAGASFTLLGPGGRPQSAAVLWAEASGGGPWSDDAAAGWRPAPRAGATGERGELTLPRAAGERLDVTLAGAGSAILARAVEGGSMSAPPVRSHGVRIVERDGSPAAGVLVRSGPAAWPQGTTDAQGRLELAVAVEPETVDLILESRDGRRQPFRGISPASGPSPPLVLDGPVAIEGRALAAGSGAPLAGALVWYGVDPGAFAVADAAGRFRLVAPSATPFWFQAEAAGRLPAASWLRPEDLRAGKAPTLALAAAGALAGVCVDPAGRPLPGAVAEAGALPPTPRRAGFQPDRVDARAVSGEDGRFRLEGLVPDGRYRVTLRRAGSTGQEAALSVPPAGRSLAPPHRFVLPPARTGVGRVVDSSGRPVAGAEVAVAASPEGRGAPRGRATPLEQPAGRAATGPDGRFSVAELPAATVDLAIVRQGFARRLVEGLTVPPGAGAADLGTTVLLPAAELAGRVVDPAGRGVGGVAVFALPETREEVLRHLDPARLAGLEAAATTGADGRFVLEERIRGERLAVVAAHPDFVPAWQGEVAVPSRAPLRLVLTPGRWVAGAVVDETGLPVPHVQVTVEQVDRVAGTELPAGAPRLRDTLSDESGWFRVAGLAQGPARLRATAQGFVPPEETALDLRETSREVTLVLRRGETLEGRVTTTEGEPIAGARIAAGEPAATTDAEGRYRMAGLEPGPATVEAYHPHYGRRRERIDVGPGVNRHDVRFPPGRELPGRAFDEAGGPVAGAVLELVDRTRERRVYRAVADDAGRFRFAPVADGAYDFSGRAAGFAPWSRRLAVPLPEDAELEAEFHRGGRIAGRVAGLSPAERTGLEVTATDGRGPSRTARVDPAGGFAVDGLPAGDWLVQARLDGGRREARGRVGLRPGEDAWLELEFAPKLALTGQVSADGEPAAGAEVALDGLEAAVTRAVLTDPEGRFEIRDLDPGRYRLRAVQRKELRTHHREISLAADEYVEVDLSAGHVAGRVAEADDAAPVADALVLLRPEVASGAAEEFLITASSGDDGGFLLPRVPPGDFELTVRKDGFGPSRTRFSLLAGESLDGVEVALERVPGLELEVRLASGAVPPYITVAVLGAAGRPLLAESRPLDRDGRAPLPSVPPGQWRLLVRAPGSATAEFAVETPGPPVPLVLEDAGAVALRVPGLATGDDLAQLRLIGDGGAAFERLEGDGRLAAAWPVAAGAALLDGVPPGRWRLEVSTPDGRSWQGEVEVGAGATARAVLE